MSPWAGSESVAGNPAPRGTTRSLSHLGSPLCVGPECLSVPGRTRGRHVAGPDLRVHAGEATPGGPGRPVTGTGTREALGWTGTRTPPVPCRVHSSDSHDPRSRSVVCREEERIHAEVGRGMEGISGRSSSTVSPPTGSS